MSALVGRTVLIIEDEPLVALDISQSFEKAGARVVAAHTREEAFHAMHAGGVTAAVLDFGLPRGDGEPVASELKTCGIPFII